MSNVIFHNKFHSTNHHTVSTFGFVDSGIDPIASQSSPFLGLFFNQLSSINADFITHSRDWYNTYTISTSNSGDWGLYLTVRNTVTAYTQDWNAGALLYTVLQSNSSSYVSVNNTVLSLSAGWPFLDTTLRTNSAIQNTRAKVFKGVDIVPEIMNGNLSFRWDLSAQQVAFLSLNQNVTALNPLPFENIKKGGEYVLVVYQEPPGNYTLYFSNRFILSPFTFGVPATANSNFISPSAFSYTVIKFVSDGWRLYGKCTNYYTNLLGDSTYYAGSGIIIVPNPASRFFGEYFIPVQGLIVDGSSPYYASSTGINIVTGGVDI